MAELDVSGLSDERLPTEGLSDEQLLAKGLSGEQLSAESRETSALFLRYAELVKIKAFKAGKLFKASASDTEDFVSEGFLGLLSAVRTYDEEKGKFFSYANACINNRIRAAVSACKSKITANDGFDVSVIPDVRFTEELVIDKIDGAEISKRLNGVLSGTELKVFNLYLRSYSYGEIASRLSLSVKAVDNALSRARVKLRRLYSPNNRQQPN
ncbi:MAG: sigma-70 family RNA polymerase sigma factor [Oscillospiraceae bacterium]|nr:sigma-70 family RNA polymerase sigma factor [Oscillospiraceae bacterium]